MSKYYTVRRGMGGPNSDYSKFTILADTDDLQKAYNAAVEGGHDPDESFNSVSILKEVTPTISEVEL